jgi:antitoxin component of RelBE/YafQ-DinJ toxin-antitoxin module
VELEWDADAHPEFAERVLSKMGIVLSDAERFQLNKMDQQPVE